MNNKKKPKSLILNIVELVLLFVLLALVILVLIFDINSRIKNGWSNNDTILFIFIGLALANGLYMSKSFLDYFVCNNKEVMFIKNDIFRFFKLAEAKGKIKFFEESLIKQENEKRLEKINRIIKKKNKSVEIDLNNIDDYFSDYIYIGDADVSLFADFYISSLYSKIKRNKSLTYEKLYSSIHSGEYIKVKRFPLFELIVSLMLGTFGLFTTIYQELSSGGFIKDPLLTYLFLFVSILFFSFSIALCSLNITKDGEINNKKRLLSQIMTICDLK